MSITKVPGGYKVRYYEAGRGSRRRSKTFRRMKDAETFENDVARRQALGELQLLEGGGKTLREVTEEWWELHAEPNLAPQTLQNYSEVLDNLLMPQLGSRRLRDLSVESVERFRADLERQGLGRHRVRRSMVVLQSILQSAVRRGLIGRNVAREARKPSGRRQRAVVCPAPAAIEAIRSELLAKDRTGDAALVSTLAYAGLRPQEALALEWRHVGEHTLLVEQKNLDGTVVAGQKTARIARSMDLCGPLAEDLADWQRRSDRTDGLVFPNRAGRPWCKHDVGNWRRRVWLPAPAAAGVDKAVTPYSLRHAFASLRIREGLSIPEVAEQMGHSPQMTLTTYSHVIRELRGSPRLQMEAEIRSARESRGPLVDPQRGPLVVSRDKKPPSSRHSSGWIRTSDLTIMSGAL